MTLAHDDKTQQREDDSQPWIPTDEQPLVLRKNEPHSQSLRNKAAAVAALAGSLWLAISRTEQHTLATIAGVVSASSAFLAASAHYQANGMGNETQLLYVESEFGVHTLVHKTIYEHRLPARPQKNDTVVSLADFTKSRRYTRALESQIVQNLGPDWEGDDHENPAPLHEEVRRLQLGRIKIKRLPEGLELSDGKNYTRVGLLFSLTGEQIDKLEFQLNALNNHFTNRPLNFMEARGRRGRLNTVPADAMAPPAVET